MPISAAAAWVDAIKKGRTFFTNGPLVEFRVDNRIPGEVVRLPAQGGGVTVEGQVWSWLPLTKMVIYHNGKVWREIPFTGDRLRGSFRETLSITRSGWLSLVAEGAPASLPVDPVFPQAGTNCVRIYAGDQPIRNRESAEHFVRWIDKLRAMADRWPAWRSQKEKDHVFAQFDAARAVYERLAREASRNTP